MPGASRMPLRPLRGQAEFQRQRPGASSDAKDGWLHEVLLAIPTWQPATQDLSEISDQEPPRRRVCSAGAARPTRSVPTAQVNGERRELLANFTTWSSLLRARLAPHWTDASCPLEGCAKYGTPTSVIYNELEGLTSLLKYSSVPIGCCGIVLHPEWQRCAYPVTLFTTAPPELLLAAIAETEAERGGA